MTIHSLDGALISPVYKGSTFHFRVDAKDGAPYECTQHGTPVTSALPVARPSIETLRQLGTVVRVVA